MGQCCCADEEREPRISSPGKQRAGNIVGHQGKETSFRELEFNKQTPSLSVVSAADKRSVYSDGGDSRKSPPNRQMSLTTAAKQNYLNAKMKQQEQNTNISYEEGGVLTFAPR